MLTPFPGSLIPFNDLSLAHEELELEITAAVQRVVRRSWFVLGPEVDAFEAEFARWHHMPHAVGVANGTDAVELALRAADIGPGDEVVTVSHTAVATVCAVERAGATPVLVDIDSASCTIDPDAVEAAITPRTRAVIPVHLYGQPADLRPMLELAHRHALLVIEDCAQAHGANYAGRPVGTLGDLAAFSFYPTKNLGACGDGGAVLTHDPALAARLRRLRHYGQTNRYVHGERGINSRLDEIQAAILRLKLTRLDENVTERRRLAALYDDALPGLRPAGPGDHAFHLYVIRHAGRDRLREELRRRGVETLIHYPVPVHLQPAYADLGYAPGSLPHTERAAAEVLSLPLFPGLTHDQLLRVVSAVADSLQGMAA
ncbi:MAG: DegT/DnrJ/EryC1/StrS family aminotransferase [Gemmataceae bacterium]